MSYTRPDWLPREQYPFAIHDLDLPSGSVRYIDEGSGPTLLFVHAGMWSFIFRDVITRLRDDYRCLTFDFPGYGLSPIPERRLAMPDLVDVAGQFIDALDLSATTLVVHDLGGPVGVAAAGTAERAERIDGLVLANTFLWTPDTRGLRTMLRIVGSRPMASVGTVTNLVPRLTAGGGGVGRHLESDGRRAFLGPYRRWGARWGFHATMRSALRSPDVTDAAEAAATGAFRTTPALTIFGEKNDPFGFQDRHAATFVDHEPVVMEGGNHFPMMDEPDRFAEVVHHWHERKVVSGSRSSSPTSLQPVSGRGQPKRP